jgi:DNA-binding NarL/FixJ family response regulator
MLGVPKMSNHPKLTKREQDVLDLVKTGQKNKEIAEHLHISDKTVETHLRHIFQKLGVKTRTEAAFRALKKK